MESGEWSATDIALKTDTAAVLECLQRSMADDDDEDFMMPNSGYTNHLSRELLSSLPPVSELKADLSPYYADRTLGLRRSDGHANLDLKSDSGLRSSTVSSHHASTSIASASTSGYASQPTAQTTDPLAAQFPAGSNFTTLTNASRSQSGSTTSTQYNSHLYKASSGMTTKMGSDGQDYNCTQRLPYQQYTQDSCQSNYLNQPHGQSHYADVLAPPPPPVTYLTGTTDAYQDAYSPQSGRQSVSCIPSDLQQVTPTIQDLGTPIPALPPPITPVPLGADSGTVSDRPATSGTYYRTQDTTTHSSISQSIGPAGVAGTSRHSGYPHMPTYNTPQTSGAQTFNGQTVIPSSYDTTFTQSTYVGGSVRQGNVANSSSYTNAYGNTDLVGTCVSQSFSSNSYQSGQINSYGHEQQKTSTVGHPRYVPHSRSSETNVYQPIYPVGVQSDEGHQHRGQQQDTAYHTHRDKAKCSQTAAATTAASSYSQTYGQPLLPAAYQTRPTSQTEYQNASVTHSGMPNASYHNLNTSTYQTTSAGQASASSSDYPQQQHSYTGDYQSHTQVDGVYQDTTMYQDTPTSQQMASSSQTIAGNSAAQMFHDALEYIAPEVITENRDSLFNPIAALTDTLLENNFDMTFPAEYTESCETFMQGTAMPAYAESSTKQDTNPRKESTNDRPRKKKKENNLLEVIKVYRCNACGFRSSDKLKALRHTIESHSRPKLNRQARFACGACHLHFATMETCCEHIGIKHPAMATAVLKDGKLYKQVMIQAEKRVQKAAGSTASHSKTVRAEAEAQAQKIAWKRKMDREQGQFICELKGCSIRFRLEENHRYHLRCHLPHPSELERFLCPLDECGLCCKRWSTMANHLWNSHRIDLELQACNRCDFRTYSLANLEKVHKLVHSEEKQFPCEQCQSRFRTIKQLKNHRYMQHSRKPNKTKTVTCPHCRQELLKKNLFAHIRQVHEGRLTERNCPQCDFKTTSIAELKSHLSTVHMNESGVHCCHQCGFLTYDHNVYRKHVLKHSADKPYKCAYCTYTSIQATTYKAHLRKNHPERARELIAGCPYCSFESISATRLQQHINKKHNGPHSTASNSITSNNNNNTTGGNLNTAI